MSTGVQVLLILVTGFVSLVAILAFSPNRKSSNDKDD